MYRIPLGLSFEVFENKKKYLQDGLNNKRSVLDITLEDLKRLNLSRNVFRDIKYNLTQQEETPQEGNRAFF
jgi:S-DNA-T family DNA segregation ATPase FtsK/SpoIIIE